MTKSAQLDSESYWQNAQAKVASVSQSAKNQLAVTCGILES